LERRRDDGCGVRKLGWDAVGLALRLYIWG
jgi:hypothetical protein